MLFLVWENKVSPFDVCRIFGERFFKKFLDEYMKDKNLSNDYEQ